MSAKPYSESDKTPKAPTNSGSASKETLRDPHPERLKRATESQAEIEDDITEGTAKFGTPSPGPARSPGSEH
ncbi:MAG: hypothetical protein JWM35_391 [Verrucomicrobia bacterium]|nr:hypothetical protein [Verrucomicrobiota bacterium]